MLSNPIFLRGLALLLVGLFNLAAAQTHTDCDPLLRDDCRICPALSMTYDFDFTQSSNASTWNLTAGEALYEQDGAELTIAKQGVSPTLTSQFFMMFGVAEVHMKASRGQGIVSSIVMQSDDLDEIDWELIGGNETHVQTNYFGKGNQTSYDRAVWHPINKPMDEFHNYTVHWTAEKIDFFIDTELVRTLPYLDAYGGKNFPQTPMFVRLGIWAGGDVDNNGKYVVEWAGGKTDFSKAPFSMYVKSARLEDFGSGAAYKYGDRTGSFESIETLPGNSTQKLELLAIPEPVAPSMADKFQALPQGTKVAIYASSAGAGALIFALLGLYFFKKRQQGRNEAAAYRAKQEAMDRDDAAYQMELKAAGINPDSLTPGGMTAQQYAAGGVVAMAPLAAAAVPRTHRGPNSPDFDNSESFRGARSPPAPGGYAPSAAGDNAGYFGDPASPPGTTEMYAPQPRANTNGSWSNAGAFADMGRSASAASAWGQQQQQQQQPYGQGQGGYQRPGGF